MRLHRLTLTNYRGIAHRDIEFADRGVTVVCGANEIGKSSMIEALGLLLESKDRSTRKDVKQVKPTHADVGAEVTAEISTGPYRFVYRKRFHKKCETELTMLAPAREQLTGDEAHDRVRAMLDDTVDTGLWQAQRVLQAASTSAVDLSGCDALTRALDVAAGDCGAELSGAEPLLVEKIEAEYGRYFTGTGRPTGQWAAAIAALRDADAEVVTRAAAVAEVDERVRAHAAFSEDLVTLAGQRGAVDDRLVAAEAADAAVAAITDELRSARAEAGMLTATRGAANAAHQERVRLCAETGARSAALTEAEAAAARAADEQALAAEVVTVAEADSSASEQLLCAAEQRVTAARRDAAHLAERDEAQRLTARLGRLDAAQSELAEVTVQLSAITLTDKGFREIERAAAAVDMARARAELTSATVEFTAEYELELMVGDRRIALKRGQSWSMTAAEVANVRLPGVLGVRVSAGATVVDAHAKLTAAQRHLVQLLAAASVADLDGARRLDLQRADLVAHRHRLAATAAGIRGDDDVDQLRARLSALADTDGSDLDAAMVRAELGSAEEALFSAVAELETLRRVAAAAAAKHVEKTNRVTLSNDRAVSARTELAAVTQRLGAERASVPDDELAVRAQHAALAARGAEDRVAALSARLAEAGPDAVAAELAAARDAAHALNRRHEEVSRTLQDIAAELRAFGTEGRTGKLDAARSAREHAAAAHARTQSRARAVELLRSVMGRHRDTTRLRYVEPFRAELERLGRTVFGPTFEVEVDGDLRIRNRTLDGRTVPYESLSGGAREQLGIAARLAVAALVDRVDSVPVLIDDALGFSDPERLARMGAVFDQVGADGQVIILTCSPERYAGVVNAHRVQLTA